MAPSDDRPARSRGHIAKAGGSYTAFKEHVQKEAFKNKAGDALYSFVPPYPGGPANPANQKAYINWCQCDQVMKGIILESVSYELAMRLNDNPTASAVHWMAIIQEHLQANNVHAMQSIVTAWEQLRFKGNLEKFLEVAEELRRRMLEVGLGELAAELPFIQKLTACVRGHKHLKSWAERPPERWQATIGPATFAAWCIELRSMWELAQSDERIAHAEVKPRYVASTATLKKGQCNYCGRPGHFWRACKEYEANAKNGNVHAFKFGPIAGQMPSGGGGRGNGGASRHNDERPMPGGGAKPRPGEAVIGATQQLAAVDGTLPAGAIILDTGSGGAHVFADASHFEDLVACEQYVRYGSAKPTHIKWHGPVRIRTNGGILTMPDALYDPALPYNIVSAHLLEKTQSITMGKDPNEQMYFFVKHGLVIFTSELHEPSGCYLLTEKHSSVVGAPVSA